MRTPQYSTAAIIDLFRQQTVASLPDVMAALGTRAGDGPPRTHQNTGAPPTVGARSPPAQRTSRLPKLDHAERLDGLQAVVCGGHRFVL